MVDPSAHFVVTVQASPVAAWFHHLFTRPVIEIDGTEHAAKWGTTDIAVTSGVHHVSVYFRYRGQSRARLAEAGRDVPTGDGGRRMSVHARLGPRNGSSFRITAPGSE
ncbi:hypothetical protein [Streptomyces cyslabdanicus]|uniref:hypothetical protein n=1 Tax=Streptomyces cyslabdanicus TaxID=1470456 RepID=UPI004043CF48